MESDLLISAILVLLFFLGKLGSCYDANVSRTITVNKNGHHADFTTVQQAIDSVPSYNSLWTRILLNHGVYSEKIVIPKDKPYIILEGDSKYLTTIEGEMPDMFVTVLHLPYWLVILWLDMCISRIHTIVLSNRPTQGKQTGSCSFNFWRQSKFLPV
ncbi:hypothetical protein M0R45_004748 [Rubus argutus]|uniref:pectinesterase n=1 Tax=Rubus argutus TaxID=59490 RepID=A0AAW1YKH3_RUBAR